MIEPAQPKFRGRTLHPANQLHDTKIEVLCSCDGPYVPHTATMLCSLLEHNDVAQVHLFYSSIAEGELTKLSSLIEGYRSKLTSYKMALEDLQEVRLHKPDWSVANYFRLLAARILPEDIEKVLYLDSDIIIRSSLKDLWDTDLSDWAFAGVEDAFWDPKLDYVEVPTGAKYFNSGVLLINLRYWRQNMVYERAINFIRKNPDKVNYYDQDALNAILVNCWINVPAIWNDQARARLHVPAIRNRKIKNPAIVHFVGLSKPWHWSNRHPFRRQYRKYRRKTPWPYLEERRPLFRQRVDYHLQRFGSSLRLLARVILPSAFRRWLKSRVSGAHA